MIKNDEDLRLPLRLLKKTNNTKMMKNDEDLGFTLRLLLEQLELLRSGDPGQRDAAYTPSHVFRLS